MGLEWRSKRGFYHYEGHYLHVFEEKAEGNCTIKQHHQYSNQIISRRVKVKLNDSTQRGGVWSQVGIWYRVFPREFMKAINQNLDKDSVIYFF